MIDSKNHWENIYDSKKFTEVSWYQEKPEVSLHYIAEAALKKDSRIIDVGGGDSYLVDFLLAEGYSNITVLDISGKALERAKERLGNKSSDVTWIEADAARFKPNHQYDIWHDRAAFHFLTDEDDIKAYLNILETSVNYGGYVILGAFSDKGPKKCSGIEIKQYSVDDMGRLLSNEFELIGCEDHDHTTPTGSIQNFTFCRWRRR